MKKIILITFLAAALWAEGQNTAVDARGLMARGCHFLNLDIPAATVDDLSAFDIDVLDVPQLQKALYVEASALFRQGDYQAAYIAFAELYDRYPSSRLAAAARIGAGDCFFVRNNFAAAFEEYARVGVDALSAEDAALVNFRKGVCAYRQGNTAPAKALLAAAAANSVQAAPANYYLGIIHYDEDDYETAKRYFAAVAPATVPGRRASYYITLIDFRQGAWNKALNSAKAQLAMPADNFDRTEMLRVAGECLVHLNNKAEGMEYLRKYLDQSSNPQLSALYLVGMDEYENGRYSAALARLEPVTKGNDPLLSQSAFLYIGQTLMRTGDRDAAIVAFKNAIDIEADPKAREAAYYNYVVARLGGASVPFVSSAKILDEFLRAYPKGPYSARVAQYLADGYLADKDYARAIDYINKVKNPSAELLATKKMALCELARQSLENGDVAAAQTFISQLPESGKNTKPDRETDLLRAQVLNYDGRAAQAVPLYTGYLRYAGAGAPNRHTAHYGLAYAYYQLKQLDKASEAFGQALEGAATANIRADILARLADIAFAKGDFHTAADYYGQAYHARGTTADYALFNRARMEGFERNYAAKLSTLNTFRGEFANSRLMPEALLEVAQAQISLGRNQDAIETFDTLIKRHPETGAERKAYLQKAMTQRDMGKNNEAVGTYKQLITKYPSSEEAAQATSILRSIYADAGRADDFLAFVNSVPAAPQLDAGDAEQLSYDSAMSIYNKNGDTKQLQNFAERYTTSLHAPEALLLTLKSARKKGNTDDCDAVAAKIVERYPHHTAAESAMAWQAQSLFDKGDTPAAIVLWQKLLKQTADDDLSTEAALGIMRGTRDMGEDLAVIAAADRLLDECDEPAVLNEARFTKAAALEGLDKTDDAIDLWLEVAGNTSDIYGAKSAFRAAEALNEAGRNEKALETAKALTQSGSPHSYWVARAFILMSDIYRAKGKTYEAEEYLRVLRENYPGKEKDIFMMIDSRMGKK